MRLLLIEDERTLCDAVARRLRRSGYSVDLAYDGERALQLLEVERYDLVLLDLNLPWTAWRSTSLSAPWPETTRC